MFKRLVDYIPYYTAQHPDKMAVVCGKEHLTYGELYRRIRLQMKDLSDEYGDNCTDQPTIVPFAFTCAIDSLVLYFSLQAANRVAVPLPKDANPEEYAAFLDDLTLPEGASDILFTTGTTGLPKRVCHTHASLLANAENLVEAQGFTSEHVFVINGPLNHIGSLSKIWPMLQVGGTLILIDGMRDLEAFYQALDYPCEKLATFLVPSSIRMLLQFSGDRLAQYAEKIDFIETGASAIARADMQKLCELLPHTRLYNTYASTETGIVATYNYNDGECLPGCLGTPMKHAHLEISPEGIISCSGAMTSSGFKGTTTDLGYLDAQNRLHLTGRSDDIINVGGLKVAPTEVEDAALTYDGVKECICIAIPHPITQNALKLLVVMNSSQTLNKRLLARHLASKLESYKVPLQYEEVDHIQRTFNGKLDRKSYKK